MVSLFNNNLKSADWFTYEEPDFEVVLPLVAYSNLSLSDPKRFSEINKVVVGLINNSGFDDDNLDRLEGIKDIEIGRNYLYLLAESLREEGTDYQRSLFGSDVTFGSMMKYLEQSIFLDFKGASEEFSSSIPEKIEMMDSLEKTIYRFSRIDNCFDPLRKYGPDVWRCVMDSTLADLVSSDAKSIGLIEKANIRPIIQIQEVASELGLNEYLVCEMELLNHGQINVLLSSAHIDDLFTELVDALYDDIPENIQARYRARLQMVHDFRKYGKLIIRDWQGFEPKGEAESLMDRQGHFPTWGKEEVANGMDAGATKVEVDTFFNAYVMQDNGCGMAVDFLCGMYNAPFTSQKEGKSIGTFGEGHNIKYFAVAQGGQVMILSAPEGMPYICKRVFSDKRGIWTAFSNTGVIPEHSGTRTVIYYPGGDRERPGLLDRKLQKTKNSNTTHDTTCTIEDRFSYADDSKEIIIDGRKINHGLVPEMERAEVASVELFSGDNRYMLQVLLDPRDGHKAGILRGDEKIEWSDMKFGLVQRDPLPIPDDHAYIPSCTEDRQRIIKDRAHQWSQYRVVSEAILPWLERLKGSAEESSWYRIVKPLSEKIPLLEKLAAKFEGYAPIIERVCSIEYPDQSKMWESFFMNASRDDLVHYFDITTDMDMDEDTAFIIASDSVPVNRIVDAFGYDAVVMQSSQYPGIDMSPSSDEVYKGAVCAEGFLESIADHSVSACEIIEPASIVLDHWSVVPMICKSKKPGNVSIAYQNGDDRIYWFVSRSGNLSDDMGMIDENSFYIDISGLDLDIDQGRLIKEECYGSVEKEANDALRSVGGTHHKIGFYELGKDVPKFVHMKFGRDEFYTLVNTSEYRLSDRCRELHLDALAHYSANAVDVIERGEHPIG